MPVSTKPHDWNDPSLAGAGSSIHQNYFWAITRRVDEVKMALVLRQIRESLLRFLFCTNGRDLLKLQRSSSVKLLKAKM